MKGSVDFLKALRHGQGRDLRMESVAACLQKYDLWAGRMDPTDFNPLIPIFGGMSMVGSHGPGLDGLLIGNDWVNFCADTGANTKNAVICLAANYDKFPGMVACSLELAMIAHKKGTDEKIRLSSDDYMGVVTQVYGNNFGRIYDLMKADWHAEFKPSAKLPVALKTRSVWQKELGYDVLIHPITLEPCRATDGTVLMYDGQFFVDDKWILGFSHPGSQAKTMELMQTPNFPPVHQQN